MDGPLAEVRPLPLMPPPSAVVVARAVVENFDGEESEHDVEVTAAAVAKPEHVGDDDERLQLGILGSSRRAGGTDARSDLGELGLLVVA